MIVVIGVIALVGLLPGLVLLAVMLPFFLLTLKPDVHGQTPLQRVGVRAGWRRARLGRSHLYRSGPLGQVPHGSYQLPGLLAASQLSEARDAYDRPFAVLCHPWVGHLTVVIETEPDGAALVDQPQVDQWVAHYGHWLAALSEEPGLLACQVCVETAPDPGTRLRHAIAERQDPHAPRLAIDTLNEIVNTYPAGAADLKARIALTFDMTAGGQRKTATELARDIATRLGGLTQRLHATGAGVAVPVDAQRLCEIVHSAYNPRAAELLEEARAAGQPARLRWEDVGPAAAEARDQSYWHDGAESVTWAMTQAPRGEVRENVLARLIAPHPEIARKRVTLLYRMIGPGEAARIVERDLHNAEFRVNSANKPSARAILEQHSASATAQEEARGAALHNFGMLVTATVLEPGQLPAARSAISNLAPTARVALRPVWGSQDSAFAAALPVGLFLPAHLRVPESVQSRAMRPRRRVASGSTHIRAAASRAARLVRRRAGKEHLPAGARGMARDHRSVMRAVALLRRGRRAAGRRAVGPPCPDRRDGLRRPDQLVSTRRALNGTDRVRPWAERVWQVDGDPPDGAQPRRVRGAATRTGRPQARLRRPDRGARRSGDPTGTRPRVSQRARHDTRAARRGAPRRRRARQAQARAA